MRRPHRPIATSVTPTMRSPHADTRSADTRSRAASAISATSATPAEWPTPQRAPSAHERFRCRNASGAIAPRWSGPDHTWRTPAARPARSSSIGNSTASIGSDSILARGGRVSSLTLYSRQNVALPQTGARFDPSPAGRQRRFSSNQILASQRRPERGRNCSARKPQIVVDLADAARAGEHGDYRRMRERKLQRRRAQGDCEGGAHFFDCLDPRDDVRGGRLVVEVRHRSARRARAGREDAGVVRSADNDAHTSANAVGQQLRQRALIEQRVAAGEQQVIEIDLRKRVDAYAPIVDAEPESADRTLVAQARKRAARTVHGLAKTFRLRLAVRRDIDVVHVDDVERRDAEPLQAVLDRAQRAVV